jgi:hypothetical protein
LLVRISRAKYIDTKKEKSISIAFVKMMEQHVLPLFEVVHPLQRFRDE